MYMEIECSCGGVNLDKMLQPGILLLVRDEKKFGYQIIDELKSNPMFEGASPDKTGVYRYLKRMAGSGYLDVTDERDGSDGVLRKCYSITPKGRACLINWSGTLRGYAMSINRLIDQIDRV